MTKQQTITDKLTAQFTPVHLEVINESRNHNVPKGAETHFKVILVASGFEGKGLVERHRAIYGALDLEMKSGVHALSLHLYSPGEWATKQGGAAKSPPCLGGSKKMMWAVALLIPWFVACDNSNTVPDTSPKLALVVSAGLISGAVNSTNDSNAKLSRGPVGVVTACADSAMKDTCTLGKKTASYSSCSVGSAGETLSGSVTMTFSESLCRWTSSGDVVTRTVSLDRTLADGSILTTTSDTRANYLAEFISGGTQLLASTTYALSFLGLTKKKVDRSGGRLYEISVKSSSPFQLSNPLSTPISVTAGLLQVYHNQARYTATVTVTAALSYNYALCCYPTAGTLQASFIDGITGTDTLEFNLTCGKATYTRDGVAEEVTLVGCE